MQKCKKERQCKHARSLEIIVFYHESDVSLVKIYRQKTTRKIPSPHQHRLKYLYSNTDCMNSSQKGSAVADVTSSKEKEFQEWFIRNHSSANQKSDILFQKKRCSFCKNIHQQKTNNKQLI